MLDRRIRSNSVEPEGLMVLAPLADQADRSERLTASVGEELFQARRVVGSGNAWERSSQFHASIERAVLRL